MHTYEDIGVQIPEILLPKPGIDLNKWAVIACDQYTSQPDYWQRVDEYIGAAKSTMRLILPEVYLESRDVDERVQSIQKTMRDYVAQDLFSHSRGLVYLERRRGNLTRKGILLALDLECYDYHKGSQSLIRASEATIQERIPPRLKIRDGASLETPHIMILINDAQKTVIEPLAAEKDKFPVLYDFDLMMDSGHLQGYVVNAPRQVNQVIFALRQLAGLSGPVGKNTPPLLFAVGDGNHSMATAKAYWEKIKSHVSADHPARYALVEIVNLFDEGLIFEPIHRVLFNLRGDIQTELLNYFSGKIQFIKQDDQNEIFNNVKNAKNKPGLHTLGLIMPGETNILEIQEPAVFLPVTLIQGFVEKVLKDGFAEKADYIHDDDAVTELAMKPGNAAIVLPAFDKSQLFPTVIEDGNLPKKSFSMGEARDKRFYLECRKIQI